MLANQCPEVLQIYLIEWCSFVVHDNGAVTQTFADTVKAGVRFVVRQRKQMRALLVVGPLTAPMQGARVSMQSLHWRTEFQIGHLKATESEGSLGVGVEGTSKSHPCGSAEFSFQI